MCSLSPSDRCHLRKSFAFHTLGAHYITAIGWFLGIPQCWLLIGWLFWLISNDSRWCNSIFPQNCMQDATFGNRLLEWCSSSTLYAWHWRDPPLRVSFPGDKREPAKSLLSRHSGKHLDWAGQSLYSSRHPGNKEFGKKSCEYTWCYMNLEKVRLNFCRVGIGLTHSNKQLAFYWR